MECLNNIIGVVNEASGVDCNNTTSLSGLFIDDTSKGRIPINAAFFTEEQILDRIIPEATTEALRRLQIACDQRLMRRYGTRQSVIGFKNDYTGALNSSSDYYYMSIRPKVIQGGKMTITGIVVKTIDGTHTGDIIVYQNGIKYEGVASELTSLELMFSDGEIFIAYQGAAPLNFKHTGCCGNKPTYTPYVQVGSGTAATLETMEFGYSDYANGIECTVVFDCDPFLFLCGIDFKKSTFGIVFAKLVQQIARSNIGYWIMTDDKLSAYTQTRNEELVVILEYLNEDINTMLNYLPEQLSQTDCYLCSGLQRGEILI